MGNVLGAWNSNAESLGGRYWHGVSRNRKQTQAPGASRPGQGPCRASSLQTVRYPAKALGSSDPDGLEALN